MKKYIVVSSILVLSLFLELFIWMRSGADPDSVSVAARYSFITPIGNADFRKLIAAGILEGDAEFGTDTELIACTDVTMISERIYQNIYSGSDGIILTCPGYTEEIDEAIRQARAEGIPIILIDNKIEGLEYDGFFGIDNYEAGRIAAECLYGSVEDYENTVVIVTSLSADNQVSRVEGFRNTWLELTGYDILEVVEGEGDYLPLKQAITELYQNNENISAFFCAEATSSMYLQDILASLNITDAGIVGFDTFEETLACVKSGSYIAVIGQDTASMGYQALSYLQKCSSGELEWGQEFEVDVFVITADNVDEYLNNELEEQEWNLY